VYAIIQLHREAPPQPHEGEPCNGCGVCCAIEPCPLGAIVSRRSSGSCVALTWNDESRRYRCGLIDNPRAHWPRAVHWASPLLTTLAHRYISAGSGCDCSATCAR